MMAGTHMTAGALVGYAAATAAGLPLEETALLVAVGVVASLVPDVDHPQSAIRQRTGLLGLLVGGWFGHRGFTHTALAAALVGAAAALLLPTPAALAVAGGYASHLLLDALTRSGVPLLWPLWRGPVKLLPRVLQVRTGSWRESAFLLGLLGAAVLIWRGV